MRALELAFLEDVCGRVPLDDESLEELLVQPEDGSLRARRRVYADAFHGRLVETLEADFPAVRRILGGDAFAALVRRYASAHPPRSHDLGQAGRLLAHWLGSDPLTLELPFLPDLAALERALADAFVAGDAESISWVELRSMEAETVAALRLAPRDGAAVVRSAYPLLAIRSLKDRPDEDPDLDVSGPPSVVLVFRRGDAALCEEIGPEEARLVEAAAWGGLGLTELEDAAPDDVPSLVEAFRRLVERGLFVKPRRAGQAADI